MASIINVPTRFGGLGAAFGLILIMFQPVQAETFRCGAGDVACLIAAINEANANGEANTIRLAAGTYTLTAVDNGSRLEANGLPVITSPLTITGRGVERTSIERDASAEAFRILEVATTGTLMLTRMTLRGGLILGGGGGGILNRGMLDLVHTTVANNRAGVSEGGGIMNEGTLALVHTTVADNISMLRAGGIAHYGATLTITHSTIESNAGGFGGGGMAIGSEFEDPPRHDRLTTITATSITRNATSGGGGGISASRGTVLITASAISENLAANEFGGGVLNGDIMEITNTTITANTAGVSGAADNGDGIATFGGTLLLLVNSTVADNGRLLSGGGRIGSGLLVNGTLLLQNTIVTGHTQFSGSSSDCIGPVTTLGNNLIGDPTGCTITLLPSDLTGDPGFGPFTDNGRPGNGHFPLLPTSQASDAGNDAICPRTDQLGRRRVGPCDIGAIDFRERDDQHDEEDDQHDEEDDQHDKDLAAAARASQ